MRLFQTVFGCFLLLSSVSSAFAKKVYYYPPTAPSIRQVASSTVVVVGSIDTLEAKEVELSLYDGAPEGQRKHPYKVANVKISELLVGPKGLSRLQVGFPVVSDDPLEATKGEKIGLLGTKPIQLSKGQEGIFLLKRHWEGDFYTFAGPPEYSPRFYDSKETDYDQELREIKAMCLARKDPIAALKSKDKESRIAAAAFLTLSYRTSSKTLLPEEENLPVEEAKLLLQAIMEMEWTISRTDPKADPTRTFENCVSIWLGRDFGRLKFDYPTPPAGTAPEAAHKLYKEAGIKFIQTNMENFTLKRIVEKK